MRMNQVNKTAVKGPCLAYSTKTCHNQKIPQLETLSCSECLSGTKTTISSLLLTSFCLVFIHKGCLSVPFVTSLFSRWKVMVYPEE